MAESEAVERAMRHYVKMLRGWRVAHHAKMVELERTARQCASCGHETTDASPEFYRLDRAMGAAYRAFNRAETVLHKLIAADSPTPSTGDAGQ